MGGLGAHLWSSLICGGPQWELRSSSLLLMEMADGDRVTREGIVRELTFEELLMRGWVPSTRKIRWLWLQWPHQPRDMG